MGHVSYHFLDVGHHGLEEADDGSGVYGGGIGWSAESFCVVLAYVAWSSVEWWRVGWVERWWRLQS